MILAGTPVLVDSKRGIVAYTLSLVFAFSNICPKTLSRFLPEIFV
jgi:hypothetical protein